MHNSVDVSDVENQIYGCLNLSNPQSFFLFAGAGSGKTRMLVQVLKQFRQNNAQQLKLNGQNVAIITYTNAACDEIKRRLEYDPAFSVSTIHSFSWDMINPYQEDIRAWLKENLKKEIAALDEKLERARNLNSKSARENQAKRNSKGKRLSQIDSINQFTYNPNGVNSGKDALNHAEVINIASYFLSEKSLMRQILVRRFPILLIDESQDTNKKLIQSFFDTQAEQKKQFCLGLFGDTMQRIYNDGKEDLGKTIPDDWATPAIEMNYRCPSRVIELINQIRSDVDTQKQIPHAWAEKGIVRLFIINTNQGKDELQVEKKVAVSMADITDDDDWLQDGVPKILTLEHQMAAKRGGFADLFTPLYSVKQYSTGILDGTLSGITFFTKQILPLVQATRAEDQFAIAEVIRKHSSMLQRNHLIDSKQQIKQIRKAKTAVEAINKLWKGRKDPKLIRILSKIDELGLFDIPEVLAPFSEGMSEHSNDALTSESEISPNEKHKAWEAALSAPLSQLESYADYVDERSGFGTHQGIKGLEFNHVMVILDDKGSKGFLFSYEKLLGAKAPTANDERNKQQGKDTAIDRTRRLFYVTCSRAEKSLAIVVYTENPQAVEQFAISNKWFRKNEIIKLEK